MTVFRFFVITLLLSVITPPFSSAMEPLSEQEMEGVRARSGISLALSDAKIYRHDPYLAYEDTQDGDNRVEFGDTASLYTFQSLAPTYVRVYENQDGLVLVGLEGLGDEGEDAMDKRSYFYSDSFTFLTQSLGSMSLDNHWTGEFALYLASAEEFDLNDADGLAFQLETRAGFDEFRWEYQEGEDNDEAFVLGGMKAAASFDDEGNPQGRFTMGEIDPRDETDAENNPASLQVLQNDDGDPLVRMNLPMAGSLRAEQVKINDHDLGPMMIDGLEIHHLETDIRPF